MTFPALKFSHAIRGVAVEIRPGPQMLQYAGGDCGLSLRPPAAYFGAAGRRIAPRDWAKLHFSEIPDDPDNPEKQGIPRFSVKS